MDAQIPDSVPPPEPDEFEHRVPVNREPILRRFGLIVSFFHSKVPEPITPAQRAELEHVSLRRQLVVRRIGLILAILAWLILLGWLFPSPYWRF